MNNTTTVRIETFTPAMAEDALGRANNFRGMSEGQAKILARAITEGRWELNNDAVAFDSAGCLINGQHRMRACVLAQRPIEVLVLRGVDDDTYFDTGLRRNASQYLASLGHTDTKSLAAAARLLYHHELGQLADTGQHGWGGKGLIDTGEILRVVERHPRLSDSIAIGHTASRIVSRAVLGFVHYVAREEDEATADAFVGAVSSGENITKGDAVYWLRERSLANQRRGIRFQQVELLALTIKAWNAWVQHKLCHRLAWKASETFPEFYRSAS